MVEDDNVRSLVQVMIMAKEIIDAGKFDEFMTESFGNDKLFVVGTSASRKFIADFCQKYKIDPRGKTYDVKPPQNFDLKGFKELQGFREASGRFSTSLVIGGIDAAGKTQSGYGGPRCPAGS
jgi:hypothetical protein